ncbi:hypothetical protein TNIN_217411 [Trichonephila inaurata madagascariensis]|uniref:Uncharacterized protein n=1 Tax=Trichonephila inaurata madagascariensis TaxID=2747483 RepID=A0A8X6XY02_9ARAC|nr:hypothetical protein TNIN_217411 [Trichonephila inaurata madagascariensis]
MHNRSLFLKKSDQHILFRATDVSISIERTVQERIVPLQLAQTSEREFIFSAYFIQMHFVRDNHLKSGIERGLPQPFECITLNFSGEQNSMSEEANTLEKSATNCFHRLKIAINFNIPNNGNGLSMVKPIVSGKSVKCSEEI